MKFQRQFIDNLTMGFSDNAIRFTTGGGLNESDNSANIWQIAALGRAVEIRMSGNIW